jgi:Holliday junction DNA helicase RuvA
MIASLSGVVKQLSLNSAVIEVGGVGILLSLPARFAASLVVGAHVEVQTSLVVREDSLTLYGFETLASRDCFELLQTVSGIGPKVAQSALSIYDPQELASAISSANASALERIPGLGKKGAARTVLELKDKMSDISQLTGSLSWSTQWRVQLGNALISLGYSQRESDQTIETLASDLGSKIEEKSISQILKLALQIRSRN